MCSGTVSAVFFVGGKEGAEPHILTIWGGHLFNNKEPTWSHTEKVTTKMG